MRDESESGGLGARLRVGGMEQLMVTCLFVDDTVMLPESERMLESVVNEFERVYKRMKQKVNVGKSKGSI